MKNISYSKALKIAGQRIGETIANRPAAPRTAAGLPITASTQLFNLGGGGASPSRIPLMYQDPMFDQILMIFPQDNLRELNRRLRHYYKYNPYIRSIIDFHTETPLSDFYLNCPEMKEAEQYYNAFKDRKNLLDVLTNTTRDHWLLGEGFAFGQWDMDRQEYLEFVQLPPEEVDVHSTYVSNQKVYSLRPNKEIQKTMRSAQDADNRVRDIVRATNPEHAKAIMRNKAYPLDGNRLIVLQRSMAGYVNRGVSPLLAVLKDLVYEDQLNLFRTVFIQRHSSPLKFFKIGDKEKGWAPPPKMYKEFRDQLEQAIGDPDYNIITHPFISVEYYSGQDKILPLIPQYELVKQRIFAGLFVSEAIISGDKTPYASGITFMRGLMNRYQTFRNNIENEVIRKIFRPMARYRGFYVPTAADVAHRVKTRRNDDKRLVVPKIYWQKANLLSNQQIQQMIINLRERGEIPFRVLTDVFGWDLDEIQHQLKAEEGTRTDPVWKKVRDKVLTGNNEMGRKLLLGDNLEEILKDQIKMGLKEPAPSKKAERSGAPGLELPDVTPGRTSMPSDDMETRPEEVRTGLPAAPGAPGELPERKPRPGEQTPGGTAPGGGV